MYFKINIPEKEFVIDAPSLAYAAYYFIEDKGYEIMDAVNPVQSFFSVEPVRSLENLTVKGVDCKEALAAEMERIKEAWYEGENENLDYFSWCDSLDDICPMLELDAEDDIIVYSEDDTLMVSIDGKTVPLAELERVADYKDFDYEAELRKTVYPTELPDTLIDI